MPPGHAPPRNGNARATGLLRWSPGTAPGARTGSGNLGLSAVHATRAHGQRGRMPHLVSDLNLPYLDTIGLERREAIEAITAARSVHWLARSELGYSVTRLQDVTAILRDQRFHSALSMIERSPELQDAGFDDERRVESILTMEGPGHARLRRLVAPAFTPASANRLRPTMQRVVGELVDRVVARGECELVADVCEPYPIPIICELLGAPPEDWKLFSGWATDIFRIFNGNLVEDLPFIVRAGEELTAYVSDMITARRADPRDDLLSDLIAVEEEGDRLSTDEMAMLAQAVLMAGTDTTRNQLACSVALFTEYPDQWALLAERPELAGRAVEESMRYLGAVRGTARFAAEDVVYRDVLFPQGTLVATSLAGANRDPEAFDDPDVFDITRERSTAQMTFGSGIHFCMGAALARAELQEALPLLARRLPGLARNGEVEWKPSTFGIWGPARLPISSRRPIPPERPRPAGRRGRMPMLASGTLRGGTHDIAGAGQHGESAPPAVGGVGSGHRLATTALWTTAAHAVAVPNDPGRWTLVSTTSIRIFYYQGMTQDDAGQTSTSTASTTGC